MSGSEKPLIVQVDGGIGRVICAVPALEELAKTRKVTVLASHPEVLWNNPNIHKVYGLSREYLWDDVIKHGEFRFPEPYFSHRYYNQELHLIQSFNELLLGEAGEISKPSIYLTFEELKWGREFIDARRQEFPGKDIALIQAFGSAANIQDDLVDPTHRSLTPHAIDFLCTKTDTIFINASHIAINNEKVWQQEFTLRQLFSLVVSCDFIITVDSFLQHAGAALGKTGISFFGGTYPENLGYPDNFSIIRRSGYPKSYQPNRFSGFLDENKGAMEFTEDELEHIAGMINKHDFPLPIVKEDKTDLIVS